MAPTTPTGEPAEIVAGDSVRWRIVDHTDYPQSEGWVLHYRLVGVSALESPDITAVWQTTGDDKDHWLVTLATSATDALAAGRYNLVKRFVGSGAHAGREETIGSDGKLSGPAFVVAVKADPRTAIAGDFQTHAEKTLALIEAVLEGRITTDLESYTIAGRAVSKISVRDLYALRGKYAAMVRQERTRKLGRPVLVEFSEVGT